MFGNTGVGVKKAKKAIFWQLKIQYKSLHMTHFFTCGDLYTSEFHVKLKNYTESCQRF